MTYSPGTSGTMRAHAGSSSPQGWLICDGSAVSRTTFAALFSIISTTYGTGNGTTTFNLPDMRGRSAGGFDTSNATGRLTLSATGGVSASTLGNSGGEQAHALITGELATHNHGVSDPTHTHGYSDPTHTHVQFNGTLYFNGDNNNLGNIGDPQGSVVAPTNINMQNAFAGITISTHAATITTNNTGSGTSHNNVAPALIVNWIIKI